MLRQDRPALICIAVLVVTLFGAPSLLAVDCNQNGTEDAEEISTGAIADCNQNGLPDECELVPPDFAHELQAHESSPGRVLTADLNADGIDDVVTANANGTVSIFLSLGNGAFRPPVDIEAGGQILFAFSAVDIDGDDDLDLVAPIAGSVAIFDNDGNGGFPPPRTLAIGGSLRVVVPGDLTGDTVPDLLVSDSTGMASLVENRGDGTFLEATPLDVQGRPRVILVNDVDGDGLLDIVAARRAGEIAVRKGVGDGTFAEALTSESGNRNIAALVAGDFDGDGDTDFAASSTGGVVLLTNDGQGAFTSSPLSAIAVRSFVTTDMDEDGDADIVVIEQENSTISLLTNLGPGKFLKIALGQLDSPLGDAAVGDLDGDGDVDIAATTTGLDVATFLLNGEGTAEEMETGEPPSIPIPFEPHSAAMTDVDGDYRADVLTANGGCDSISVLRSIDGGVLEAPANRPFPGAGHMNAIATADFNGDRRPDMVAGDLGGRVQVLLNIGAGVFGTETTYDVTNPFMLTTADVDGDSHIDILAVDDETNLLTILFNDGGGTFAKRRIETRVGTRPLAVAAGDLDGDADVDLVTANEVTADLSLLLNNGDGTFPDPVSMPTLGEPRFITAADFDGDGDLDLAFADGLNAGLAVLPNRGDATFEGQVTVTLGRRPYSVITADANTDGNLDLVTANEEANGISIVYGDGRGQFAEPIHRNTGEGPRFVVAGDVDADGDIDLVATARDGRLVTVFLSDAFPEPEFTETLCTLREFHNFSRLVRDGGAIERLADYLVPQGAPPAGEPGSLFPDSQRFASQQEFLTTVFPDRFGDLTEEGFSELVEKRASREYYAGAIRRLRTVDGIVYGFSVLTDATDDTELLTLAETQALFADLSTSFQLQPLGYFPETRAARNAADGWENPGFPIFELEHSRFRRGDVDASGSMNIADIVVLTDFIFRDGPVPTCVKTGDTNDSGTVDIEDVVDLIGFLFRDGPPPREPNLTCERDPTEDLLSCASYAPCG